MPQTRQCRKSAGTTPSFCRLFHAHLPAGHCLLWSDRSLVCPFAIWVLYKVLPQLSAPDEIQAVGFIGSIFQRGAQGQAAGVGLGRCCQLPGPILSLRGNGQLPAAALQLQGRPVTHRTPFWRVSVPRACPTRAGTAPAPLPAGDTVPCSPAMPAKRPLRSSTAAPACTGCASKIRRASGRRSTRGPSVRRPSACFAKIAQGGVFFGIRFVFCQPAAQGKQLPLHHAHLGGIVLG